MTSIKAEVRDAKKNTDHIRAKGGVPAVFYGRKEASQPITIEKKAFDKVLATSSESTVFSLEGPWGAHDVLIQEVKRHSVTDEVSHVDFYVLEKDRKVKVKVPLEFTGVAPAVKDLGGTLVKVLHDLEIEALPKDLPSQLSVDIGALATLDSQILAKDITLPSGVALVAKPEEVVASVAEYKEEVEQPVMDISQIEVEKKGKVEEEGAEGAPTDAPAAK